MESSHEITKAVPLGKSRSSLRLNSRPKRRFSRTTEPDRKEMRIIDDEAMDEIMEFCQLTIVASVEPRLPDCQARLDRLEADIQNRLMTMERHGGMNLREEVRRGTGQ